MWARLEKTYMPWTDYGDLEFLAKGGRWQAKPHIYGSPFYYIDYTLAQCCAMQFWVKSRRDYASAMEAYVGLCARGGSAPFQDLVRSAGLVSPSPMARWRTWCVTRQRCSGSDGDDIDLRSRSSSWPALFRAFAGARLKAFRRIGIITPLPRPDRGSTCRKAPPRGLPRPPEPGDTDRDHPRRLRAPSPATAVTAPWDTQGSFCASPTNR